jgi:diaminopimelate epimerase
VSQSSSVAASGSEFVKYQALGNDYLVLDPAVLQIQPTAENIRLACDRHYGVGADGVLIGPLGPVRAGEPVELRLYNSDGTECEKSGNGFRIFALYLKAQHGIGDRLVVRTKAGDTAVEIVDPSTGLASVDMGRPDFSAAAVPVLGMPDPVLGRELALADQVVRITSLNNGNPHTVLVLDEVSPALARELGPQVATHPAFPERTNVQLVQVLDPKTIRIEIWERGAGYTLSSGSSSCAAAAACHELGLVSDTVQVLMQGGAVDVRFDDRGAVTMTGTAELVASGSFGPSLRKALSQAPVARP